MGARIAVVSSSVRKFAVAITQKNSIPVKVDSAAFAISATEGRKKREHPSRKRPVLTTGQHNAARIIAR